MEYRSVCQRTCRRLLRLVGASGAGTLFVLGGCDTEVQTAVLGGLNDLANTLVDTLFMLLEPEQTTPVTTAARVIADAVSCMFC